MNFHCLTNTTRFPYVLSLSAKCNLYSPETIQIRNSLFTSGFLIASAFRRSTGTRRRRRRRNTWSKPSLPPSERTTITRPPTSIANTRESCKVNWDPCFTRYSNKHLIWTYFFKHKFIYLLFCMQTTKKKEKRKNTKMRS